MKKFKALCLVMMALVVVGVCSFALIGCGNNDPDSVEGNWKVDTYKMGDSDLMEQLNAMKADMIFKFENGTVAALTTAMGETDSDVLGPYEVSGNKITIGKDDDKLTGTIDGGHMKFDQTIEGLHVLIELTKQ